MGEKMLMKGNEAIAEAAIQAGCRFFFGYPITPQNQIPEYMSKRLPKMEGGCFLQAESEVAAINMVYGAAGAGARVMTSSSSPGISLKQEGISYIVGAELPCVIVNMVRGGPGLGSIQPAQSDYYQSTRGGGHGDYRMLVLAPSSVQEAVELTQEAFDLADKYRNPVLIMGDGLIGQMMEPVEMPEKKEKADLPPKTWAATGWKPGCGRDRAVINSLYIDPAVLEKHVNHLYEKYAVMEQTECRWQEEMTDDADYVIVAYGTTARIARSAMRKLREEGIKAGLIRPITLWPFPAAPIAKAAEHAKAFLTVEMSMGQMVDDVKLAVNGLKPVHFFGRTGGQMAPTTLPGQVTTTSPYGRDPKLCGWPIRVSEMLATLDGPAYISRVSVHDVKHILDAKKCIKKAFETQIAGKGFSLVEVLSACPTNWGMTPQEALKWLEENMIPQYPLGVKKEVE